MRDSSALFERSLAFTWQDDSQLIHLVTFMLRRRPASVCVLHRDLKTRVTATNPILTTFILDNNHRERVLLQGGSFCMEKNKAGRTITLSKFVWFIRRATCIFARATVKYFELACLLKCASWIRWIEFLFSQMDHLHSFIHFLTLHLYMVSRHTDLGFNDMLETELLNNRAGLLLHIILKPTQ